MTVRISQDSFVNLLEKSGLISRTALSSSIDEFHAEDPGGQGEGERLAQFLIRKGELTTWQAKKLLQGKYKGFTLGKYKLLSLLGRGGMSSVYLAEHVLMRRRCAIKVLPSKQVNDVAALTRFHQEAQAVAALDDPNIVRAYDVDHVREGSNDIHFLVMEYVEGRSLQEVVDQDGPLPIPAAIDYICQAASGLDHAHAAGMVHRDIKPSNLLLDLTGTVKVLDMGLARFFEQADQESLTLQHDQRVLGTADYLSPEQAVDSHGVDTRSDIYSLGGTLYFLLAGHPPFPEGTLAQRLLAHQTKQPRPINEIRPDVPASLLRILVQMMAKSPDGRPSSAGAARDLLLKWLNDNGDSFADAPPHLSTDAGKPLKPADPTAAGWSDVPEEIFHLGADSAAQSGTSHVVDDKHLGDFLTKLDSDVTSMSSDSERLTGAKTVVSKPRKSSRRSTPTPAPPTRDPEASVVDDMDFRPVAGGSTSLSGSRVRRQAKSSTTLWASIAGGACLLLAAGFFLWPDGADPPLTPPPPGGATSLTADQDRGNRAATDTDVAGARPPVERGADITVGPEGNFATIGEAIAYVRDSFQPLSRTDQRTIRVAGGETYVESMLIDNSQFGAFPQGVEIICEDAEPAILAPAGTEPVVHLINVERFRLHGFELAGEPRPVVMRLEGYLGLSKFENVTVRNAQEAAIQTVGVTGGRRVDFRSLLIHQSAADCVGLEFVGETKEVVIEKCRFAGPLQAGVHLQDETANLQINECRFHNVGTPVRFATAGLVENVTLTNNTFSEFEHAVSFGAAPRIGTRGVGFDKNLFVGGQRSEVFVEGGSLPPDVLSRKVPVRFNWSDRAGADEDDGVDIFARQGRRGVSEISFVSQDATRAGAFLKPVSNEMASVAQQAPPPKFIGAVAPQSN